MSASSVCPLGGKPRSSDRTVCRLLPHAITRGNQLFPHIPLIEHAQYRGKLGDETALDSLRHQPRDLRHGALAPVVRGDLLLGEDVVPFPVAGRQAMHYMTFERLGLGQGNALQGVIRVETREREGGG